MLQIYTDLLFVHGAPPPAHPFCSARVEIFTRVDPTGDLYPQKQQEFHPLRTETNIHGERQLLIGGTVVEFHRFNEHHLVEAHMLLIQDQNKLRVD